MSEVINNRGADVSDDVLYDYNVRINPQGNHDVEVFTIGCDENGYRDRYDFTFRNHPTPQEIVEAIKLLNACQKIVEETS